MSQTCDKCGTPVYKNKFLPGIGKWVGVDCGCTQNERMLRLTLNPFAVTMQHVRDEAGHPIRVESLAQLSAAEKRYGFESCVLNRDAQNFNDTPSQVPVTMNRLYQRKFGRH